MKRLRGIYGAFSPCMILAGVALLVYSGCDSNPKAYAITGKISYQGKPVNGGLINFLPEEGPPLGGRISEDGTYAYQLPLGEYKVRIDTPPPVPEGWKEGEPLPKLEPRQVPAKYGRFHTSKLTATVEPQSSSHEINFELP